MFDPELVKKIGDYIKENLKKGFSLESIKHVLLESGYSPPLVIESISYLKEKGILQNKKVSDVFSLEDINKYKKEINNLKNKIEDLGEDIESKEFLLKGYKRKNKIYFSLLTTVVIIFLFGLFFGFYLIEDINEVIGFNVGGCIESWVCSDWSDCESNQKVRTCTDQNVCGTELSKPELVIDCDATLNISGGDYNITSDNNLTNLTGNFVNGGNITYSSCYNTGCTMSNPVIPCWCGSTLADLENPWCCLATNDIYSTIDQEGCLFCGGPPSSPPPF